MLMHKSAEPPDRAHLMRKKPIPWNTPTRWFARRHRPSSRQAQQIDAGVDDPPVCGPKAVTGKFFELARHDIVGKQ
jgi:hypothetical protein